MTNYLKQYKKLLLLAVVTILFASCEKNTYYIDGGKSDPKIKGTVLEFLKSKPAFDSVAQVVEIAGMEDVFRDSIITFFAPTDLVIKETVRVLNANLFFEGKDTIQKLDDVNPLLWRKYLSKYIMRGKNKLQDFPQIDFDIRTVYPGANTYDYTGAHLYNIGVVRNDQNGIRYAGYRQLAYTFIPDPAFPLENWRTAAVATSDLEPTNGVVHVLAYTVRTPKPGDPVVPGEDIVKIGALPISRFANLFGMSFDFIIEAILDADTPQIEP